MNNEELISSLIAKRLDGEASQQEWKQLEQWLNEDPANQAAYEQVGILWQSAGNLDAPALSFDTNVAWEKMDAHIRCVNDPKIEKTTEVLSFSFKWIAVAAAVVALLTAIFFLNKPGSNLQIITAKNEHLQILLKDGSRILLRKGSTLTYPSVFDANARRVDLSGEAFFEVFRNEQQPFYIKTTKAIIKVLGTSFLVRSVAGMDEVVVKTGKVSVMATEKRDSGVLLVADERAIMRDGVISQTMVKDSNYIAWKTGVLEFRDIPLANVLYDIAHYYNRKVSLAKENAASLEKTTVTVRFQNQPFEKVLEQLRLITGLGTKIQSDEVIYYQK